MTALQQAAVCALALASLLQTPEATPQVDRSLAILVLDGRSGKPIAHHRLLIFTGATQQQVRDHTRSFDLTTGDAGVAMLRPSREAGDHIQVFVDGMHQCQPEPNLHSFNVSQGLSDGLVAPNDCGSATSPARPGWLVIFARKLTFSEKMAL